MHPHIPSDYTTLTPSCHPLPRPIHFLNSLSPITPNPLSLVDPSPHLHPALSPFQAELVDSCHYRFGVRINSDRHEYVDFLPKRFNLILTKFYTYLSKCSWFHRELTWLALFLFWDLYVHVPNALFLLLLGDCFSAVHLTIQDNFVCKKMSLSFGRRVFCAKQVAIRKSLLVIILLFN